MHMTWSDLQDTPSFVQRVWWDCIQARREAENEAHEAQQNKQEGYQRIRR